MSKYKNRSTPRFSRGSSRKARKHMLGRNFRPASPTHELVIPTYDDQPGSSSNNSSKSNNTQRKYIVREIVDAVEDEKGNLNVLVNFKDIEPMWFPYNSVHNGEKLLENYKKANLMIPPANHSSTPTSSTPQIPPQRQGEIISSESAWKPIKKNIDFPRVSETGKEIEKGKPKQSLDIPRIVKTGKEIEKKANLTISLPSPSANHSSTPTSSTPQIPPQRQREVISSESAWKPIKKNIDFLRVSETGKEKGKPKQLSDVPRVVNTEKEIEETVQMNIPSNNKQTHHEKVKKGVKFSGQVERQSPPAWRFGLEMPRERENLFVTPKSILKDSTRPEEISHIKQVPKTEPSKILLEWKGLLILNNKELIQKQVVVRPLKGHCPDSSILKGSMPKNQIVLDNLISFFYVMKLMEKMKPLSIFVMQPATHQEDFTGVSNVFNNCKITKKIGIIYLDEDESLCIFVFPNIDSEYKIFDLPQRPPNAMALLVPFTIPVSKPKNNPNVGHLSFPRPSNVDAYYAQVVIVANKWQDILPEICKTRPKFAVFGVKESAEVIDLINALKFYDAVYVSDFEEEGIEIVFIQFDLINQLSLIPHLVGLKKKCQFRIFGCIPHLTISVKLKVIFSAGGYVLFTSLVAESTKRIEWKFNVEAGYTS
ncbi:1695_t:CDS:2 [Ambispora gerdemannii]|uniref:1695_t:CDS:1 n=1 Tax=Ambispora gerdemannii TaxID=144530 RepID=A0A9N9BTB2_9GLOM|nr:1695_t:CDS:2 [Ambispora gerdemannii]